MREIKLNDIADSLIIFNKITFDRLLKSETPADSIALYTFYYYTAKWQGTNQPKCTTAYVANGLKWSESRVRKAKKELLDIGLVEDITSKDESGKIIGHFVKVNYFSLSTLKETHTIENPQCGIPDTVEKLETNALKEYIKCLKKEIEMLKNNKESKKEKSNPQNSFDEIFKGYTQNEETLRGDKNVQNRGDKNVPHNNTSINNNIPVFFEKEKQADELFERLWKEYPNKKGKADVYKTNKLELLKFGYDKLSRAIKNYDKSVVDKKFLMYGSRFFKTGFLDYLETKEETSYSNIRRI